MLQTRGPTAGIPPRLCCVPPLKQVNESLLGTGFVPVFLFFCGPPVRTGNADNLIAVCRVIELLFGAHKVCVWADTHGGSLR